MKYALNLRTIALYGTLLALMLCSLVTFVAPLHAADSTCASRDAKGSCNLGYTPLEPLPGITSGSDIDFSKPGSLSIVASAVFRFLFTIGALFSVVMLTVSGIRYMLSEIVTEKSRALDRIRACIYALLLLACSWLILNTINPQLLNFTLNPGSAVVNSPNLNANAQASPYDISFQQAIQNRQQVDDQILNMTDEQRKDTYNPQNCAAIAQKKDALVANAAIYQCSVVPNSGIRGRATADQCNSYRTQRAMYQDQLSLCPGYSSPL